MRPPDDSFNSPSPEDASPSRARRRLIFTLPGENAAETWSEPTAQHGQHSSYQVLAADGASSGIRKRSGDYVTYLAEMTSATGAKRQRMSEDYGLLQDKCIVCRFLDVVATCYNWACVSLLAWLCFRWCR
ncbi:uncharacterized protein LOC125943920 [Dermacentor silvarum]|uniref:uncharacterized protein LOC125943920 n=1 Tax=Dermacentor silvarum TaxID=543639 RepID=UPI002101723B|nr:uncharacterized protein LOC125943920 [Dermacentor silvarum]